MVMQQIQPTFSLLNILRRDLLAGMLWLHIIAEGQAASSSLSATA
jgi:hypothetical protein